MENLVIGNYLQLDFQTMILTLISVFLIVVIVKKYFWDTLKEYLEKRQAHIQGQLDESNKKLEESATLKEQYESQIAGAKSEAKEIVDLATSMAKQEASTIVESAKQQAMNEKEKAQQEIEYEKTKVREEMKQQISEVAFLAAQKVVEKELDAATHKKYVDDFIDKAGEEAWQA